MIEGDDEGVKCLSYAGHHLTIEEARKLLPFLYFSAYHFPVRLTRDDLHIRFQGYYLNVDERAQMGGSPFIPSFKMTMEK